MNSEQFEAVFERIVEMSRETLVNKAREYANDGDRLHNFKKAGAFQQITPEEALFGMLTKHLVSVSDMVRTGGDSYSSAIWDEKIGDSLNYLILLRALVDETAATKTSADKPVVINQTIINNP